MVRATFRPRPPPPWAALIATGRPCSFANAMISSGVSTGSIVPATKGAPTTAAIFRAETLSPRERIAAGGGPIQIKPAAITRSAKSAFSDKKP
ncbi:unannotated protein [freshwater metagenome]|uniref:Unannotated protein n=1 Tax=freshwater metagenome TaxID=449393 RepID=A0A6J7L866_9ZZZZ